MENKIIELLSIKKNNNFKWSYCFKGIASLVSIRIII